MSNFLDSDGLLYFWQKLKAYFATTTDLNGKVDKVTGKGLSTNDYTTTEKNKLSGIASGAQVNVIETVKVNGTALSPTSKAVDVTVPTKTSDITNDSGFITASDVPEGAAASSTTPKMDGTAKVGTETAFARGDHVHPSDTSRVPTTRKVAGHALSADVTLVKGDVGLGNVDNTADDDKPVSTAQQAALNGKVDKVSGKGLSTNDYTTNEKNKLSGIATGAQVNVLEGVSVNGTDLTPTDKVVDISVPTKTSDITNDSGYITSASLPGASSTSPKMNGTAAVGTETAFARGDHIHPSDTTRVPTTRKVAGHALSADVTLAKGDVGLGNVDNTSDANKPVSTAQQAALNGKVDKVSGKGLSTNDYTTAEKNKLAAFGEASTYALKSDITNMYKYKGSVATVALLPSTGQTAGDVYNVEANGMNYAWNGEEWDALGEIFTITSISNSAIDTIVAS